MRFGGLVGWGCERKALVTSVRPVEAAAVAAAGADGATVGSDDNNNDDDDDDDDLYTAPPPRSTGTRRSARGGSTQASESQGSVSFASSRPADSVLGSSSSQATAAAAAGITPARLAVFRGALSRLVDAPVFNDDYADVDPLIEEVNKIVGSQAFGKDEALLALEEMTEQNQIMLSGNQVYKV